MRGPLAWILVAVGIVAVLLITLAIGARDKSGETVPAGEWAQTICGAVGAWRGQMESIVEEIRTPASHGALGVEEPQSETPQGRGGFVRVGLEQAIEATDTLVVGIDNAGTPDTPGGAESSEDVSAWAIDARLDLEEAQGSLDEEADTLEDAVTQIVQATGTIAEVLATGRQTLVAVAASDPELAAAIRESSTCEELRDAEGAE